MSWLKGNSTAVVTGAAGGIGLESAKRFVAAGMNVVLVDVKEEQLTQAASDLSGSSGKVITKVCDVSNP